MDLKRWIIVICVGIVSFCVLFSFYGCSIKLVNSAFDEEDCKENLYYYNSGYWDCYKDMNMMKESIPESLDDLNLEENEIH
jgi:hypothetical protein